MGKKYAPKVKIFVGFDERIQKSLHAVDARAGVGYVYFACQAIGRPNHYRFDYW